MGNSKNINDSPTLKSLMLQKMMNSPIEKENSSKCMDMIVSKTMSPSTQSSPMVILFHINFLIYRLQNVDS